MGRALMNCGCVSNCSRQATRRTGVHYRQRPRDPMPSSAEYTVRDQDRMKRAKRYFEWQFRMAEAQLGSRVLEIGCGLGNFTQHLLVREFVTAIDVEPDC